MIAIPLREDHSRFTRNQGAHLGRVDNRARRRIAVQAVVELREPPPARVRDPKCAPTSARLPARAQALAPLSLPRLRRPRHALRLVLVSASRGARGEHARDPEDRKDHPDQSPTSQHRSHPSVVRRSKHRRRGIDAPAQPRPTTQSSSRRGSACHAREGALASRTRLPGLRRRRELSTVHRTRQPATLVARGGTVACSPAQHRAGWVVLMVGRPRSRGNVQGEVV